MTSKGPILVTGGAGYIGAHACKALAAAGWLPVAFDNLVHGHEWAVQWGPLEIGDVTDRARLDEAIARHRPLAAIHFAAFTAVGESVAQPGKYYRNNVVGTLTLAEALAAAGVSRLVFSSTAAVYGHPPHTPISEDSPLDPVNPYGRTKLAAERLLADFAAAHGIAVTALRYFNAAGADPDGALGESHEPETHLIPLALAAAICEGPALRLFGDDYATADGTCVRDYIHVTDLAAAHVAALGGDAGFRTFNLGTGRGFSVREVLSMVERVVGRPVPHEVAPRRPGDPAILVADPTRAGQALGWRAELSDLETIVATALEWQRGRGR